MKLPSLLKFLIPRVLKLRDRDENTVFCPNFLIQSGLASGPHFPIDEVQRVFKLARRPLSSEIFSAPNCSTTI